MQLLETLAHLFHPRRSNNHRAKVLHPQALFALALMVVGFGIGVRHLPYLFEQTGHVLGYASNITASDVLVKTNAERAKVGLPPLSSNTKLNEAALAKAENMFQKQYWAHIAPDGTEPWFFFKEFNYHYRVAGENLARDFGDTDDMVKAWIASPTHKANILNAQYQETGIAVVNGRLLGTETTLVVQLFGTPIDQAPGVLSDAETGSPSELPQQVSYVTTSMTQDLTQSYQKVLGGGTQPLALLSAAPLLSPLQLSKAFFLAVIIMLVVTLLYDAFVMSHRNTLRLVGKNLAHIMLLLFVAFLLLYFKGGVIG